MATPADTALAGRRTRFALLEPSVWLSGRLSFSRKYLLIGVVVLFALASLSRPLWQKVKLDREVAERERAGLREVAAAAEVLSGMVVLRDQAVSAADMPSLQRLDAALGRVIADASAPELAMALSTKWQQLEDLEVHAKPQQRFAAFNGVINSMLSLIQAAAQSHRLNVDHELDATFAMLTVRLPQVLDILGKQQGVVTLATADMAPFALGAQVALTESFPVLQEGIAQLLSHRPAETALKQHLARLLAGIALQQDAADKALDAPDAWAELKAIASANEGLARTLFNAVAQAADAQLSERISGLQRSQWIIGALLVGALAAISYLFAGIYLSTMRSLTSLSRGTADFCAGRLDARIRIDTRDELVLVSRNFNTMAEEFSRLLGVIREQNESRERELETQVLARTAELAEKNEQLSLAGRRVQEELSLARDMQRAILPLEFPDEAGWAVHACMYPARELGGDFYDVLELPDGRCGVLVADVSGKGVAAAFFMAVSRTVLLDLATTGLAPGQVLAQANELLCQRNPMQLFVTVCYAVFDPASGSLVYASGGHPEPLRRRLDGSVEVLPCARDLALAVLPQQQYAERASRLAPGDTLLLYTDGVTEAFSPVGEEYGDARLKAWFSRTPPQGGAAGQVDSLVQDVEVFVGGAEASDDLTCLILCRKPGVPAMTSPPFELQNKVQLLEYELPSRVEEIEKLAEAVTAALPDRSDLAFSANLCLEELVTNIIQHGLKGQGDRIIHVRMSMSDEWLEIILKDDAPQFDPFVEVPDPDLGLDVDERPVGGLGVHLVKTLMDDVRAYYDGSGNWIVLLKTLRH